MFTQVLLSSLLFLGGNTSLPPCSPLKQLEHYLLLICLYTVVKFNHVAPNEPDQIGEVWDSGFVSDVVQHGLIIHFVDIQGDGSHSNSNHTFRMIEELDGFCVQGKVIGVLKQKMVPKVTNPQDRPAPKPF